MLLCMFGLQRFFKREKIIHDHYPFSFLDSNNETLPSSYGIIILNHSKPSIDKRLTEPLWSRASIRICADGGTNELSQFTFENREERLGRFTPDFIVGDLDSIKFETKKLYEEELKVPLIEKKDQDSTDFTKCLQILQTKMNTESPQHIYVFCTFAGRFDQAMSIIHTLYLFPNLPIFLISEEDVTFLLKPGQNRIHQVRSPFCGSYCSLVPFAGPVQAVTSGLQWNLDEKMELNYHTLISTSNTYSEPKSEFVTIDTPESLVWSMTFADPEHII